MAEGGALMAEGGNRIPDFFTAKRAKGAKPEFLKPGEVSGRIGLDRTWRPSRPWRIKIIPACLCRAKFGTLAPETRPARVVELADTTVLEK
jgi:hypothetical protein